MKNQWQKLILYSLGALLLVNVFQAFFLYQKKWNPIEVGFTVTTDYNTSIWTKTQPKFSKASEKTGPFTLIKNVPKEFIFSINEPEGVQFLGLYWSQSNKGVFSITNAFLKSNNKHWDIKDIDQLVAYTSNNVATTLKENVLSATSQEKANGWMMLNSELLEEISFSQQFIPLGIITNAILLLAFLIFGIIYQNKWQSWIEKFQFKGSIIYRSRRYLLSLWFLLLPFWHQFSHVMLAISLAILIVEYFKQKKKVSLQALKLFIPFWILFFGIILINTLFHSSNFNNDFGDYIYFLLTPFLFLGIKREDLVKVFSYFQVGILCYIILLFIGIAEQYLFLENAYSFQLFFIENVETYWHTSYLGFLIIFAVLFYILNNKPKKVFILLFLVTYIILMLLQARLPLIIGSLLLILVIFPLLPEKRKKYYAMIIGTIFFGTVITFIASESFRKQLEETVLINGTEKVDARPELWKASVQIFENHPFSGIGRSNVRNELSNKIPSISTIKNRGYNAHNQYLEFLISYGLSIPLLLLVVFAVPILKRFKTATIFVLYFSIVMLVESYFSRQAGVILFSLFYCFFIMYDSQRK